MRTLTQVVSRHDAQFGVAGAYLGLGRDGYVYLVSAGAPDGRVLRVAPDGSGPRTGRIGYPPLAVTANAAGVIATAENHFLHRIAFWNAADFTPLGHVDDFTANDTDGYYAPSAVEAGESGDFYAIDQHRLRVLRLNPDGVVKVHSLGQLAGLVDTKQSTAGLRVAEGRERLYTAWQSGGIWASRFDGSRLWNVQVKPAGHTLGSFDVSDDGYLYVLSSGREVKIFDLAGARAGSITLALPDDVHEVTDLRLSGNKLFVRRSDATKPPEKADPATLFEVYDRVTGKPIQPPVVADVERLTVSYEADVWTAGQPMPLTITHDRGRWAGDPRFRVWLRPLGVPEFTELPLSAGTVIPPAEARGLYQLRVSPDVAGNYSEYVADGVIEVRPSGAVGSLSIWTPLNRFYYGRGERIDNITIQARVATGTQLPTAVSVNVLHDGEQLDARDVALVNGMGTLAFDAEFTASLEPGRYVLDADLPGFTVAPQYLQIGPGLIERPAFHLVQYGDIYGLNFPTDPRSNAPAHFPRDLPWFRDVPETTEAHLARAGTLGINLFVDRLGPPTDFQAYPADYNIGSNLHPNLFERLTDDPVAVAPDKAYFEDPRRRVIAGYGAYGMEEQAILLGNDVLVPLDERSLKRSVSDLEGNTNVLASYPAFRGWSWAANWWLANLGVKAAKDDEKAEYQAAVHTANTTGAWSAVLETVSDRTFATKPCIEACLRAALNGVDASKIGAMTGPYREPECPPQIVLAHTGEVDLHFQAEQLQPPLVTGHMVDFYRRPGKPAWGHPELWNDDGTGGMVLPTLFQQVMRGANGTGMVTDIGSRHDEGLLHSDERSGGSGPKPGDPRSGGAGKTSVVRAAFDMITRLGPAIVAADSANRVAIVVSTRMQRLETDDLRYSSVYFQRLFEAYSACLYAHRPASFVFTEDVSTEALQRYQAVLVVSQTVEFDPPLDAALRSTEVPVFADATCRNELVSAFKPLGFPCDKVEHYPLMINDDSLYYQFRADMLDHAQKLRTALVDVPPVAECDNPEVFLSEWTSGSVRYIWAVNNTMPDWDPGLVWRVGLLITQRLPVLATLKVRLPLLHEVVDLLTGRVVSTLSGEFTADLRSVPARLYAVVPLLHGPLPSASGTIFGPHVRDIAVSPDGQTAALITFNWDHNLYGLDLTTGKTTWRQRIGHHFAYTPTAQADGFAAQGFDVLSAEGYHLYLLDPSGTPRRRFALFGLPKRATDRAVGEWGFDLGLNNFAVAPDGSWVATSGDLGLALWDSTGAEKWAHQWWATRRTPLRLLALDNTTLVTFAAETITGLSAADGSTLWTVKVADSGAFGGGVVSGDRRTVVIWSEAEGGRLYVIRDGALTHTVPAAVSEVSVPDNGSLIAATSHKQLKAISADGGLLWTYTGDDLLRRPRVSPDGTRIAVGSELGTLAVLNRDGTVLATEDLQALPVPAWLPGGDLLAATWMGTVVRYDTNLRPRWQSRLTPAETDIRSKLLTPDPTPLVRRTGWGNATDPPLRLTPNLIPDTSALITAERLDPDFTLDLENSVDILCDGRTDPPAVPWLPWQHLDLLETDRHSKFLLTVDTFRTQIRLTGITFAEDPAHPESWMRDVRLQWWDTEAELWRDGPLLLSDRAVHSHVLDQPIEASRFRFATTGGGAWPAGNLRLGELVFHGQILGNSHRDVIAKRPLAVLFDQRTGDLSDLRYAPIFGFRQGDGYSDSGTCVELSGPGEAHPIYRKPPFGPPFGHAIHDWNFEITQNPAPSQYRYFQFAWKTRDPQTTGIGLRIGPAWPSPAVAVSVGDSAWLPDSVCVEQRIPGPPPTKWTTVRVDLWALTGGRLPQITSLSLRSNGGGALFDQLVLGRTTANLPPQLPPQT